MVCRAAGLREQHDNAVTTAQQRQGSGPRPISTGHPGRLHGGVLMRDELRSHDRNREWKLLLAAVERLHERGLTGIRALPSFGSVGFWRFEITTARNLRAGVNLPPRDEDAVLRLSAGSFPLIVDLLVSAETTVDEVADELFTALGSPRETSTPHDREYCEWFAGTRRRAEELDAPPSAFGEYQSSWRCGETEIDPPPGWTLGV